MMDLKISFLYTINLKDKIVTYRKYQNTSQFIIITLAKLYSLNLIDRFTGLKKADKWNF